MSFRYGHLLLLSAERAWAQAMHVKTTRPTESSRQGLQGSTRKHIISRLYRAHTYAEQILVIAREMQSTQSHSDNVLEAEAYVKSLAGFKSFEKNQWENALQDLSEARFFYSQLSGKQESKATDVFAEMMSSSLDPNIRYAAYQIGLPRTTSIEAIVYRFVSQSSNELVKEVIRHDPDALKDPSKKAVAGDQKNVPKTIVWRKRTVNIEDAATAQALAAVSAATAELSSILCSKPEAAPQVKAAEYDRVLIPSQDAVDATRTAIEELTAEGVAQGDPRMQALQITRTAVNYALIKWRIGRNRILCGPWDGSLLESKPTVRTKYAKRESPKANGSEKKQPTTPIRIPAFREEKLSQSLKRLKERVVLYDGILQSLDSIKDLPGVAADGPFLSEISSTHAYFAALRCLAIARSHALLSQNRECLALLSHALDLSSSSSSSSTNPNSNTNTSPSPSPSSSTTESIPPNITITREQTTHLHTLLENTTRHYRALVELLSLGPNNPLSPLHPTPSSKQQPHPQPPLVTNLTSYPTHPIDLTNLVKYPPALEAIPVKPIFLDLAYNYIEYPSRRRSFPTSGAVQGGGEMVRGKEEGMGMEGVRMEGDGGGGGVDKVKEAAEKVKKEAAGGAGAGGGGGGRKGWFGFGR